MKWININDKKPIVGEWVLILFTGKLTDPDYKILGGGIAQARLISEKGDWMLPYWIEDDAKITHWMELPEWPED